MTSSGSTNFNLNLAQFLEQVFRLINVIGEGDQLASYDYNFGKTSLNSMLKAWEADDHHIWLKKTVTLFLQPNQNTYSISATTTDHATGDDLVIPVLTVAANIGDTTITVDDSSLCHLNDNIGIMMDNNTIFWTTITGLPTTTSIVLTAPLTDTVAVSKQCFVYTTPLAIPFKIYSAARRDNLNNIDVPLNYYSYREYFEQPNKIVTGTPVVWNYDRQIDEAIVRLWPTPSDSSFRVNFIVSRSIQDMDSNSDTFDLPVEWLDAITYNLAVRIAPAYGKAQGDNFAELRRQAMQYEQDLLGFDNEQGSIYIIPSWNNFRRA